MAKVAKVSSTEFAGKFGKWSFEAQRTPIQVTNQKTGVVLGYFVAEREFEVFMRIRDELPWVGFAWEMDDELAAELEKPLTIRRPELDHLMDEE